MANGNRSAIGGAAGLLLLALAFGWRWLAPPSGSFENPSPPPVVQLHPQGVTHAVPLGAPTVGSVAASDTRKGSFMPLPVQPPEQFEDEGEEVPPGEGLSPAAQTALDAALATAGAAASAGRLIAPPDDNALAWYEKALLIDSRDRAAREGRAKVIADAVEAAHSALDQGDLVAVDNALAALANASKRREVVALAARRAAQAQVAELLRQGAQRMAAGQRFEPRGASALDSYRGALALDARNRVAVQGMAGIEAAAQPDWPLRESRRHLSSMHAQSSVLLQQHRV